MSPQLRAIWIGLILVRAAQMELDPVLQPLSKFIPPDPERKIVMSVTALLTCQMQRLGA